MRNLFTTAAIVLALATPALAEGMAGPKPAGTMSGPQQPQDGMSGGMMAGHDQMAKDKKKSAPSAMKHDGMAGGSMSGPAQPSSGGMSGGMNH
jgi:pentapeptide MXKDX repeat protein